MKHTLTYLLSITLGILIIGGCKKTVVPPAPVINAISPASGPPGTTVVITGKNFSTTLSDNTVSFTSAAATVVGATATTLTVLAPPSGTTGPVTVSTLNGNATGPVFTYVSAKPTITSISPTSGPAGTTVVITGTNFSTTLSDNTVAFNSGAATIIGATATTLTVLAPASGTTGPISVSTLNGNAAGPVFTYVSAKPTITSISPTSGPPGTTVIITGTNFSTTLSDNTVSFTSAAATIIGATATTLTVLAPPSGTTGKISVSTLNGSVTGPVFTYVSAKPTITSISPISGPPGTTVIITGTNFSTTLSDNTVSFTSAAATIIGATATTLTVLAPPSGTTGKISVSTLNGSVTGPVFTYVNAKPTITSISPTSAAAGATITITGTNFNTTAANNTVKFNATAATVTNATATQLTVTVPAGSGSENITVATTGGTSNTIAFTYTVVASGPDIYVLGSDTHYGFGYWKNSTFNPVPDCKSPYAMVGIGSDIYFAGPAVSNTPTYWKNGTAVQLSAQTGYTFSIAKSGTDLYCLGSINGKYYVWKNGTPTVLNTTGTPSIGISGYYINNAIAVNNGDVYVAGSQSLGSQSTILKATYWKNGSPVDLTDGIKTGSARATAVYVSGSDLYVAGVEEIRDPNTNGIITVAPRLWKNGVPVAITAPIASLYNMVYCILVVGSDVYIGGEYNGAGAVWKNGVLINTATYAVSEQVASMFLYNNTDLYFIGAANSSGLNGYWKNGNFVEMDPGCQKKSSSCSLTSASEVVSIYVK